MPLYPVFCALYMLLEDCAMRGACGYCWDEALNASEDEGRECNMEMVLVGVIGGDSTSAIGSAVVEGVRWDAMARSNVWSDKAWREWDLVDGLSRPAVSIGVGSDQ